MKLRPNTPMNFNQICWTAHCDDCDLDWGGVVSVAQIIPLGILVVDAICATCEQPATTAHTITVVEHTPLSLVRKH